MIGIIAAMDAEINELKENIQKLNIETISDISYYKGFIYGEEVVVAKCGIGKVFAAMCAQTMILKYHPDKIFHIGIAGALDKTFGVNDVAIASSVVQHDIDQTPFGYKKGQIQGLELIEIPCDKEIVSDISKCAESIGKQYRIGVIASGDQFIESADKKNDIAKEFNAIAVEMEGASTGQVCYVNKTPFVVIRAISDGNEDNATKTYKESKQTASDTSTEIVLYYLKSLKEGLCQ